MKKLAVYAMTEKGYAVVRHLADEHPGLIEKVIGGKDAAVLNDYYRETRELCAERQIEFYDRAERFSVEASYSLAVSWKWMIRDSSSKVVVFHDSLLPRYRGFNPLVTALLKGDSEIGVTALFGEEKYDTGAIIAQSGSKITYPIKISRAIEVLTGNYQELAGRIASAIKEDKPLEAVPQDDSKATYSLWRDEDDYLVDWKKPARYLKRFVDAVGYPYKGASAFIGGRKVRITEAEEVGDLQVENRDCGKVIFVEEGNPIVVCGERLLRITGLLDDSSGENLLPIGQFRVRFSRK